MNAMTGINDDTLPTPRHVHPPTQAPKQKSPQQHRKSFGIPNQTQLLALLQMTGSIVWTTSAEGRVRDAPPWHAFTGQSVSEMQGWGWTNAIHPDDRRQAIHDWKIALTEREPFVTKYRIRRVDGIYRQFAVYGVPVFDKRGHLRSWVGYCLDITERSVLEQQQVELLKQEQAARTEANKQTGKLEQVLTLTTDAFFVLDAEWRFTYVNPEAERLLEHERHNLVGHNFWETFPGSRETAFYRAYQQAMCEQVATTATDYYAPFDRWYEARAYPTSDNLTVFFQDVTARKRLESEREAALAQSALDREAAVSRASELEATFAAITDGVMVCDADEHIVRANAHWYAMMGIPPVAEYSNVTIAERLSLFHVRDEAGIRLAPNQSPLARILKGEVLTGESDTWITTGTRQERVINIRGGPLRDANGQITGAVAAFRDVTERRRLEAEREAATAHELALVEVTENMDRFLAMASHDLRTPLTAIMGNIQFTHRWFAKMQSKLSDEIPSLADDLAKYNHVLSNAEQGAKQLANMMNSLFDIAKARSGTLEFVIIPCDLIAVVQEQIAMQRQAVPKREIRFDWPETSDHIMIEGDPIRLGQVVLNYLTNALKYSPNDAPVQVTVRVERGSVLVMVSDRGPGVPESERERVWEPFHQVPETKVISREEEGLGLGLHICKTIIERHHGQVGVESVVGSGSTFWFTVPLA